MNSKSKCFSLLILIFCLLFSSCDNKNANTNSEHSTPTVNETKIPTLSISTPLPSSLLNQASPLVDNPELDKTLTYLTYQPNDKLTVYVSETKGKPHIVIDNQAITCAYEWEYNLDYGDPIVKLDRSNDSDGEALYIILPTNELEDILMVEEICGKAYVIDSTTLQESTYTDDIKPLTDWLTASTTLGDNSKEIFTLEISPDWARQFMFPGIDLPKKDSYSIVLEEVAHYSDSLYEYRRVGIRLHDNILWLGKFCDDITLDASLNDYIFLPYQDILYSSESGVSTTNLKSREEQILEGTMVTLDPSDAMDLNRDGIIDTIDYRNLRSSNEPEENTDFSLTVNDKTITYHGDTVDSTPYAGSLDGKTIQLIIFDNGPSADPSLNVYQYNGKELSYAGSIPSYDYTLNDGEITAYCESVHLQCFRVARKFSFQNGQINEIEQEFYEQGNNVTVLKDLTLYEKKDEGTLGITLTKGSEVIIVGSDLKEWVYIQDLKSGNYGWLRATENCLLPDGREVPSWELFDGLYFYG